MLQHVGSTEISRRSAVLIVAVVLAAMMPVQLVARVPLESASPGEVRAADAGRARDVILTPVVTGRIPLRLDAGGQSEKRPAPEQEPSGDRHVLEVARETIAAREAAERLQAELEQRRAELAQKEALYHRVLQIREAERNRAERESLPQIEAWFLTQEVLQELQLRARAAALAAEEQAFTRLRQEQESEVSDFDERLHLMRLELERVRNEQDAARETEWRLRHIRRKADPQRRVYARGDLVALTPADDGTRPPNASVLAVPGDHVRVSRAGVIVNGTPSTGVSAAFLAGLPEDVWEQVIPADHYFVAAEQQDTVHVIRFWGLVPAARIAGTP